MYQLFFAGKPQHTVLYAGGENDRFALKRASLFGRNDFAASFVAHGCYRFYLYIGALRQKMGTVQALGQMAVGCVSFSEALYRPDVTVSGNLETLEKVFIRKPILVEEHF